VHWLYCEEEEDGIACVYELNKIQAGDMIEFSSGVEGIALNLKNENVGIVACVYELNKIQAGDMIEFSFFLINQKYI
jgi:F-type H+-transporting ATPase subunit alpha